MQPIENLLELDVLRISSSHRSVGLPHWRYKPLCLHSSIVAAFTQVQHLPSVVVSDELCKIGIKIQWRRMESI